MKKYTFLFFFILYTCPAFASSTASLTTYYPAPIAAYSSVKLPSSYVQTFNSGGCQYCNSSSFTCCNVTNNGMIFQCSWSNLADPPAPMLMECFGNTAGTPFQATQWCASGNPSTDPADFGMLVTDPSGTLHACLKDSSSWQFNPAIYPQQCYNTFCSFTYPECSVFPPTTQYPCPCNPYGSAPATPQVPNATAVGSICAPGYAQVWLSAGPNFPGDIGGEDVFQTSPTNFTISYACCTAAVVSGGTFQVPIQGDNAKPVMSSVSYGEAYCWWWDGHQYMAKPGGGLGAPDGNCP